MISYEKALETIAFLEQQLNDLISERDRLGLESSNASNALINSNEQNSILCEEFGNAQEALLILGIEHWNPGVEYQLEDRVQYDGIMYHCVQAHTSQEGWEPNITPALWARMSLDEWPEWIMPTGVQDAYKLGDKVSHNGIHWISDADANVWEPGVYGWIEA